MYDRDLERTAANFRALTPLDFLAWAERVYPDKIAVIHGEMRSSYRQFGQRCRRMAGALERRGIGIGDTVAVIAPNVPMLLEAHYGVPMVGAVLNAINFRLDATAVAFILGHGQAKLLIVDVEFVGLAEEALAVMSGPKPALVVAGDAAVGPSRGGLDYDTFLGEGSPFFVWSPPTDEWQAIALSYTSGTTGNPKGVVYHHRGAFLNAIGNAMTFRLGPDSVYLWTLPMFHCSGWSHTWAVTAVGGTHVCMRRLDPADVFALIETHRVTHLCGAPVVLTMLINVDGRRTKLNHEVQVATGGASPPPAIITAMENIGFRITHLYGLTESYGPATVCVQQDEWGSLPPGERARNMARQGMPHLVLGELIVADERTGLPVPADGETMGEVCLRGHTIMKGYLNNPKATREAFLHGWFHTGDLGVMHRDGYIEIKDRSKDIIISGGENISSIEVEDVLYEHPAVMEAAVVAKPDEKWGETPCAFVTLKPGAPEVRADDLVDWCRTRMAHFKCPRTIVFSTLPKTSTGKIQKVTLREMVRRL